MASNYTKLTSSKSPKKTSQKQPIPGREAEQVQNSEGAFTFSLDTWGHLDRFLILGSSMPSYYASAKKLTLNVIQSVDDCIKADGLRTVARIVEISTSGRAPKNDPAVFALAWCAIKGNKETVAASYAALPKVCRIGTHLFQFVEALNEHGKWNAAAKRGIAAWYQNRSPDRLALQLLKYQSRDGWSHRDVLRLAHIKPKDDVQSDMFKYTMSGEVRKNLPSLYATVEQLKAEPTSKVAVKLIRDNADMTWEMIPTELHRDPKVMEALLPTMGVTALIRKLGQLSSIGLLTPLSATSKLVIARLTDAEALKASRIHPITLLNALKQYSEGHGLRGSLTWNVVSAVTTALNEAFYDSFNYIESTGQSYLLGVDCSPSMRGARVDGTNLNAAEVAAVMAMAIAKREPNHWIGGFSSSLQELKISTNSTLEQVQHVVNAFPWAGTDCAAPMTYAQRHKMDVDKLVVITDNETHSSNIHPCQALVNYRKALNKNAKLIVCATSVTNFTIADPKDPGMLDIVGFDSSCPQLIQSF